MKVIAGRLGYNHKRVWPCSAKIATTAIFWYHSEELLSLDKNMARLVIFFSFLEIWAKNDNLIFQGCNNLHPFCQKYLNRKFDIQLPKLLAFLLFKLFK